MAQGIKTVLTPKQEAWFKKHFKNTKNDEICAKLGISTTCLHRFARLFGLKKTGQFMKKMQANAVAAAQVAIANETPEQRERRIQQAISNRDPSKCFKKGVYSLKEKTPEEMAEIHRKQAVRWKAKREKDIARINLGLDPKGKFRMPKDFNPKRNRALMSLRYNLRRGGYEIPKLGSMVIYITPETKRCLKREENGKKLGLIFKFQE